MDLNKIKRRKFLDLGAAAIAELAFPNFIIKKPQKKLGVALLGLGLYSRGQLAPALTMTKHCYLAGIITGSPEKIPVWQKKYRISDGNIYSYSNMHQIENNDSIDVIYVVTPTGTHADFVLRAADTGKHIWCEKPMAMNVAECKKMINACINNRVKLTLGYRVQHEPNTQIVNSYTQVLPFNRINKIDAAAGYYGGGGTGWRFQKEMGGGALYDMGVYTVNGMRRALNLEPIKVLSARQYSNRAHLFREVDETTEYSILFKNGILGSGKTSVGESINHLKVDCEEGWYELRPMQTYSGVRGRRSDGQLIDDYLPNQQAKQMDDDAYSILNNQRLLIDPIEGLKDIGVIEAIVRSAKSGKPVGL
ncbi:MAG: Gfo/Idh/MocA family oxidoreductase [Bacteroidota bacterium]